MSFQKHCIYWITSLPPSLLCFPMCSFAFMDSCQQFLCCMTAKPLQDFLKHRFAGITENWQNNALILCTVLLRI